jgi:hypothetical protein
VEITAFVIQAINSRQKRRKLIPHYAARIKIVIITADPKMNPHNIRAEGSQSDSCLAILLIQFQKITCAISGTPRKREAS